MSKRVRVILLEDIPAIGMAGDIVAVSEGYARNALFPAGQAALATEEHRVRADRKKQAAQKQEEEKLRSIQEYARLIDGTELTVEARTKDDAETIYGTVNAARIAKELHDQGGLDIAARDIILISPITKLGPYEVTVAVGSGLEATIHVVVKKAKE